jgi:hypothetical protein
MWQLTDPAPPNPKRLDYRYEAARRSGASINAEWTLDDQLRQPVFLGLWTDKQAKDVVRE